MIRSDFEHRRADFNSLPQKQRCRGDIFQQFCNFGAVLPYTSDPSKKSSNSLPASFNSCPVYTGLDSRGTGSFGLNLSLQIIFSASEEVWHRFLEVGISHLSHRTFPLGTLKPDISGFILASLSQNSSLYLKCVRCVLKNTL